MSAAATEALNYLKQADPATRNMVRRSLTTMEPNPGWFVVAAGLACMGSGQGEAGAIDIQAMRWRNAHAEACQILLRTMEPETEKKEAAR